MTAPKPWQGQTLKTQDKQSEYLMRLSTLRQALLQQEAINLSQGIERLQTQSNQRYGRPPIRVRKQADESAPEIHKRKQLERMRRIESFRNRKEHMLLGTLEGRTLFEQTQMAVYCGNVMRQKARNRNEEMKKATNTVATQRVDAETPPDSGVSSSDTSLVASDENHTDLISSIERKLGNAELQDEQLIRSGLSKKTPILLQNMTTKSMFNLYRRFQTGELRRFVTNGYSQPTRGQCQSPVMGMIEDLQQQNQGNETYRSVNSSFNTDEDSCSPRMPIKGFRRQKLNRALTNQTMEVSQSIMLKIDRLVSKEADNHVRPKDNPVLPEEPSSPRDSPTVGRKPINVKGLERRPSLTTQAKFPSVRMGPTAVAMATPNNCMGFVKPLRRAQSLSIVRTGDGRGAHVTVNGTTKFGRGLHQGQQGTAMVGNMRRPPDNRSILHPGATIQRSQTATGIDVPRTLNIEIPFGGNVLQDREDTISQCSTELPRSGINVTF